jgi:hypothetical protein
MELIFFVRVGNKEKALSLFGLTFGKGYDNKLQ